MPKPEDEWGGNLIIQSNTLIQQIMPNTQARRRWEDWEEQEVGLEAELHGALADLTD